MYKARFFCIDAHTCGNPVRLVASGVPPLPGSSMMERRNYFMEHYDWIRRSLMFEPRGHDMMSGSMLYPPCDAQNDVAVLFIETSGCLPMCGHGTIGTITAALEEGLIIPKTEGIVRMEAPAGLIEVSYTKRADGKVSQVTLKNVPSFLHSRQLIVDVEGLGSISADVAYGGNFYVIVDPQENFRGIEYYTAEQLIMWSRSLRNEINKHYTFQHPELTEVNSCTHVMWTGACLHAGSTARNAVFYGDKAIDRSPCGTGTSARMAQWHAQGKLKTGDFFIHESYIGSIFTGRVEQETTVGDFPAIIPGISGWAKIMGYNHILVDPEDDPYAGGFQVI